MLILIPLIILFCILLGVGIALVVVTFAAGGLLVSFGIVSSSFLVGLQRRSITAGARLAIYEILAVVGAVAGAGIALGARFLLDFHLAWPVTGMLGLTCGVLAGLVLGGLANRVLTFFLARYARQNGFEIKLITESSERTSSSNTQAVEN